MPLDHIKREVNMMLGHANQRIALAEAKLTAGNKYDRVKAAGELNFLKRQKEALAARTRDLETAPKGASETLFAWLKEEWFNMSQRIESWIADR
jgi:hypothetical protein